MVADVIQAHAGKYLLEKMTPPELPRAKLVKSPDGFLVFRTPKGSPMITSEQIRKLEAETL